MTEKKSYQSWTISDELWNVIKDEIPQKKRDPEKVYKNKPGQGRKPMDRATGQAANAGCRLWHSTGLQGIVGMPVPCICARCNQPIKRVKLKDGSIMQAAEFATTHEGMCADCYKATRLNVA